MIKLYSFGNSFGVVDPSPFVVKVATFLRMAQLPYETVVSQKNLGRSPKNKLPFIDDNGKCIGDSQLIIDYLSKEYSIELDGFLSAEQQAQAYLLTKSLDENLYWCLVHSRWVLEDTWPLVSKTFFGKLPAPLKWFVPSMIQKKVKKNLYGQGLGRHSTSEILAIADKSFSALSVLLGDKSYFFGEQPSSFDASAYGILSSFISVKLNNSFNEQARKYDNLVAYCQHIEAKYYASDD